MSNGGKVTSGQPSGDTTKYQGFAYLLSFALNSTHFDVATKGTQLFFHAMYLLDWGRARIHSLFHSITAPSNILSRILL